jgi:hypothetical protein
MAESSPILDGRSRKTLAAILQGLARVGQVEVAKATGKSETWISRAKDDDLKTCAILLTACGLKVSPVDSKCYTPEYIEHLRYFARIGIAKDDDTSSRLTFDEDGE